MKKIKNMIITRIILMIFAIILLIIPWYQLGFDFPSIMAGGKIIIDTKYIVVGFLYILLILLKVFEAQNIERQKKDLKMLCNLEETMEKILQNALLMILAYNGFITVIIPVLIIAKMMITDTMKNMSADNGKMLEKSRLGICEKGVLHIGIIFLLFYNLPFELWNFYFADACIIIATILSVLNGTIYYFQAKNLIVAKK